MNCHQAQELVSEALDGALPAAQADEFRNHLGECPGCRTYYAEFRESLTFLTELPRVEVGDSFDRAVWAKIHAEEPRRAPWARGWSALRERLVLAGFPGDFGMAFRWSPLAAAATLLVVLAVTAPDSGPVRTADVVGNGFDSEFTAPAATFGAPAPSAQVNVADFGVPDEFGSEIPEAIELFLQQNGRDLRLQGGDEDRLRRSDYVYPVRRLQSRGNQLGTPVTGNVGTMRPVANDRPAVIAF